MHTVMIKLLRNLLFFLIFNIFTGMAAQASAINDCIDACYSASGCASNEAQSQNTYICQSAYNHCVQQCNQNINHGQQTTAPRNGAFGALAYDQKSGAWAISAPSQDKSSAQENALAFCNQHSGGCQIAENIYKACVAVAAGTGNRLGWAAAPDARQAGMDAITRCGMRIYGGNDHSRCFMQTYQCYFP